MTLSSQQLYIGVECTTCAPYSFPVMYVAFTFDPNPLLDDHSNGNLSCSISGTLEFDVPVNYVLSCPQSLQICTLMNCANAQTSTIYSQLNNVTRELTMNYTKLINSTKAIYFQAQLLDGSETAVVARAPQTGFYG